MSGEGGCRTRWQCGDGMGAPRTVSLQNVSPPLRGGIGALAASAFAAAVLLPVMAILMVFVFILSFGCFLLSGGWWPECDEFADFLSPRCAEGNPFRFFGATDTFAAQAGKQQSFRESGSAGLSPTLWNCCAAELRGVRRVCAGGGCAR